MRQHELLRQFYPEVELNKLQEVVNSSLTFVVVRWDKSSNLQILCEKVTGKHHRHPLDRFLASYIDKVEKGDESWAKKSFGNLNFTEFVDRMLEDRPETWNEHWAPIHQMCPPCIRSKPGSSQQSKVLPP